MNKSLNKILISIDALLDTRSGTMFTLSPEKALENLKSKMYAGRIIDIFKGFDKAQFDEAYKKRNKNTLKFSSLTNAYQIIEDIIEKKLSAKMSAPEIDDLEVHLNTYPFVLSDKEKLTLKLALSAKLSGNVGIKTVDYSLEELNPYFIKTNYKTLIMYEFFDWLEIHSKNELIKKHPISEVTYYAPALVKHIDSEIPKNLSKEFINIMLGVQPFVGVIFHPVDVFCSFLSNTPEKNEQVVNTP